MKKKVATFLVCVIMLSVYVNAQQGGYEEQQNAADRARINLEGSSVLHKFKETLEREAEYKEKGGRDPAEGGDANPSKTLPPEDEDEIKRLKKMTVNEFEEAVFPPEKDPNFYDQPSRASAAGGGSTNNDDIDDSEYWDYTIQTLQSEIRDLREALEEKILQKHSEEGSGKLKYPDPLPVPREPNTLRYESFLATYMVNSKPLVISNMADTVFGGNQIWNRDHIAAVCAKNLTVAVPYNKTARAFYRSLHTEEMAFEEFLDKYGHSGSYAYTGGEDETKYFLLDWSILNACPQLLANLTIPEYFVQDFLQRIPDTMENAETPYKHDFPVLFMGPRGAKTNIQIDSLASHSWHIVTQGSLKVRLFSPKHRLYLYEDRVTDSFAADPWEPNLLWHPLMSAAQSYEVELGPGDVLVLPAGTPYAYEVLEDVVMLSMNWIDLTCLHNSVKELTRAADTKDVQILLKILVSNTFDTTMVVDPQPMPWWQFKKLSRGSVEPERVVIRRMAPDSDVGVPPGWKTDRRIP